MVNNKFNRLTLIRRYFRITTISCIISISILGGRVSINPASAEELPPETEELSSAETLPGLVPIEPIPLGESQSSNIIPPNVPALTNRVIYRLKDNATLLGILSTAQMADFLNNSNNPVEKINPLLTPELLANSAEIKATSFSLARTFVVTLSSTTDVENIIKSLSQLPFVEYAEPDQIVQVSSTPNDTYFGEQWNLNNTNDADVDAPEAWDINTASKWIRIAILDTGAESQHTEFKGKLVKGVNFTSDDATQWEDGYGHGTHVAGIAAAKTNNGIGIAGICWGNCMIMPVKVLTDDGWGYYSWIANGIVYAAKNSAKVINLSLGSTTDSQTLHEAIQYAYKKGVTIVAATGNSGGAVLYPAAYPETIAVAATNENDGIPWWSNRGSEVDLAAPGVTILSTYLGNSLTWMSGTSMATPHVAGAVAALQSFYRQTYGKFLNPEQVRCYLQQSANDLGLSLDKQGAGRLNLEKLLLLVTDPNFVCDL